MADVKTIFKVTIRSLSKLYMLLTAICGVYKNPHLLELLGVVRKVKEDLIKSKEFPEEVELEVTTPTDERDARALASLVGTARDIRTSDVFVG